MTCYGHAERIESLSMEGCGIPLEQVDFGDKEIRNLRSHQYDDPEENAAAIDIYWSLKCIGELIDELPGRKWEQLRLLWPHITQELTLEELAEKIGTSKPTVSRVFGRARLLIERFAVCEKELQEQLNDTERQILKLRRFGWDYERIAAEFKIWKRPVTRIEIEDILREIGKKFCSNAEHLFRETK